MQIDTFVDVAAAHERAWQANHAAVGAAKDAAAVAAAEVADIATVWRQCRFDARDEHGHPRFPDIPGPECGCGECASRYFEARDRFDIARAAIAEAIELFKAGVTIEQHAAALAARSD